jgi:hypothetical protein
MPIVLRPAGLPPLEPGRVYRGAELAARLGLTHPPIVLRLAAPPAGAR